MNRSPTPLQRWRAEYGYIVRTIKDAKAAAKGHKWGDFKRPKAQQIRETFRTLARDHMAARVAACQLTKAKWDHDHAVRLQLRNADPARGQALVA